MTAAEDGQKYHKIFCAGLTCHSKNEFLLFGITEI